MCRVELLQLLEGGMCVSYGSGDGAVPHELAKEHEVRSGVKHVGSEGVTQDVRTSAGEIGDGGECRMCDLVYGTREHRRPLAADEEGLRRAEDRGA